jgi:hypothetical protein
MMAVFMDRFLPSGGKVPLMTGAPRGEKLGRKKAGKTDG